MKTARKVWMNKTEYRQHLARLELTPVQAAELFGVSPRTGHYWASGFFPVPKAVAMSLRVMKRKEPEKSIADQFIGVPGVTVMKY